ncbi:unnamed protein product [Adineta ricciae]|uniref:TM2 domain-containing protein n=1 Tax=Adineta ricciae TaxID=249248 RepID=A0A814YHT3_ADIRI|nr:unnamed protein product [Adineta ricciae]CAF1229724.1 unnamed protein product [Adineta ricciae]
MHNTIYCILILICIIAVDESRFVPRPDKVHYGNVAQPRRWGKWCYVDNECGLGFCSAYKCQCYPGYITWYFMDTCSYEQRKKLTAFLLSFFVGTLGIDWFYLSRGYAGYIVAGIIKLLLSGGCCFGWPFILMGTDKKSRKYFVFGNAVNIILSAAALIWWLIDWIRILADAFHDGYGAPLQPWGYQYYYNGRFPYRV